MQAAVQNAPLSDPRSQHGGRARTGKALVVFVIAVPTLFGIVGLVVDGGLMMIESRRLQSLADVAATGAARELSRGANRAVAQAAAIALVHGRNGLPDAGVAINIPPLAGPYAGDEEFVEAEVSFDVETYFIQVVRGGAAPRVRARSVAGVVASTAEGVVAVLDPTPPPIDLSALPIAVPPLPPAHLGGLEVLGAGQLRVEGAVFVNAEWGGVDEQGDPAGSGPGPPYGLSATPLLPLTGLRAADIRVAGGVDNPAHYAHIDANEPSPLQANKMPIPDPLQHLPAPTFAADSANVVGEERGGVSVANLPLFSPPVVLDPGIYEWIEVVTGRVIFRPGVYILRNVNPVTGCALSIVGGQVIARGVMFYITDTANYNPETGVPDAADGDTRPPGPVVNALLPRVVIAAALLGSRYSPLNDPQSPFDGVLIYQRRTLREPLVIVAEQALGSAGLSGNVYAKWGQLVFVGHGEYDLAFAVGSARIVNVLDCTFAPTRPFPPAKEVFLVE